jgi:microcompartment protein CcmL/EutN
VKPALGVLEISALGAALVILDEIDKAAPIRLLQAELNDYYGYVIKIVGEPAALCAAIEAGRARAEQMQARCVTTIINAPDDKAWQAIESPPEYQPLLEQEVVFYPRSTSSTDRPDPTQPGEPSMSEQPSFAIGLIETQGFTAVIEAIDTACKAANVEVLGKEKLGGGYVTVLIKGDVAAVSSAIEAGKARVNGLGNLIAAHVIPRPSTAVLSLLPE